MRAKFLPFLRHVYPLCKIQSSKGYIISNVGAFFLDNSIDSFRRRAIDMFLSSLELTRFQPTKRRSHWGMRSTSLNAPQGHCSLFNTMGAVLGGPRGNKKAPHRPSSEFVSISPWRPPCPGLQHGAHAEVIQAIFVRQHRAGGLEQRIRSTASFLQNLFAEHDGARFLKDPANFQRLKH